MKKLIKILFVASCLSLTSMVALADTPPPPPGGGGGVDPVGPPVGAPIDGGLGVLLTLGVSYGAVKIMKYRKEKEPKTAE